MTHGPILISQVEHSFRKIKASSCYDFEILYHMKLSAVSCSHLLSKDSLVKGYYQDIAGSYLPSLHILR